ncbi:hypothetical protein ALC53_09783 [Atta colombica]|uniref:Uncharacterized protein n=1 Tax=Atta colombica TaxID=520822 RepID=A0A195B5U7_9HYME|nr:hypothetical protein ALC53_09783 [Atta colombica]
MLQQFDTLLRFNLIHFDQILQANIDQQFCLLYLVQICFLSSLSSGSGRQWSETRERNREKGWIIDRKKNANKVTISIEQISCDYKLMKHNDEEDENLRDVGDEETAGVNNITMVVKMPIADSTRDIRYMSPQADSRRMAWSRKQRGAGEIDLSARWRSGGKPANPTRKSQRAQGFSVRVYRPLGC